MPPIVKAFTGLCLGSCTGFTAPSASLRIRGGTASRECLDPLLKFCYFLGVTAGQVGLLGGILGQVKEFDLGRKRRLPHELPVPLAHGSAERLDVVDHFVARRGRAFANGGPDEEPSHRDNV
jgi:hypothetical protein